MEGSAPVSAMQCVTLRGLDELRGAASAWDDLWFRSSCAFPTARAEPLANWVAHFAPRGRFQALAVRQDGLLVAALPLCGERLGGLLPTGNLPANGWTTAGALLLDPRADVDAALDCLVAGVARVVWPLVWMQQVPLTAPEWVRLVAALERAELPFELRPHTRWGVVDIQGSWSQYEAWLSGNHRRHMNKASRRATKDGHLELEVCDRLTGDPLLQRLVEGFAIEDRNWKRQSGTSVLRTPGMFGYFQREASLLARWNQLRLVFLKYNGVPIAFEYGYAAKRTYFTPKVGYDEAYSHLTPGQLLRWLLVQRCFDQGDIDRWDFFGALSPATAKWNTSAYDVGRLAVAPRSLLGRGLFAALRQARLAWQQWQRQPQPVEEPPPGDEAETDTAAAPRRAEPPRRAAAPPKTAPRGSEAPSAAAEPAEAAAVRAD